MNNKRIGIVIIGRNEGERLILCLESVLKVRVPCVYVDSQSQDNSVAEAEQRHIKTVILDKSAPVNASRARNTGFETLVNESPSLEYIHFIDADCELHPDWLEHAISALDNSSDIGVVCGRLHEKFKDKNIYTRLCDMDWYIEPGEIKACGGIASIRRKVFEETHGYNELLIAGADPELYSRIRLAGYKIICLPVDMGTHDSNMDSFSQYWKRSVKTGYGFAHNKYSWGGWDKQYKSAILWAGFFPVIIILLSIFVSWGCLGGGIYPLQVARIYFKPDRKELSSKNRIIYSFLCVLGKFSEFQGIIRYHLTGFFKKTHQIIEYKKA